MFWLYWPLCCAFICARLCPGGGFFGLPVSLSFIVWRQPQNGVLRQRYRRCIRDDTDGRKTRRPTRAGGRSPQPSRVAGDADRAFWPPMVRLARYRHQCQWTQGPGLERFVAAGYAHWCRVLGHGEAQANQPLVHRAGHETRRRPSRSTGKCASGRGASVST